ncbi:MAG: RecQ family ATP-dependent DNA helicase [Acutalibacteraceae bacterium]
MKLIIFIDTEVNPSDNKILDLGAVTSDDSQFHSNSQSDFSKFVSKAKYIAGHNILMHDLNYVGSLIEEGTQFIDTLFLSPLMFPTKPYHALLKDDKLQTDTLSNPLNDAVKSMELFFDEVNAFQSLDSDMQKIYYCLLNKEKEFSGFFDYIDFSVSDDVIPIIRKKFKGKICENVNLAFMVSNHPIPLAYCLATIFADDKHSIIPPWVCRQYPLVENYMRVLRNNPCDEGCLYCKKILNVRSKLKEIFGYDNFRTYNGEPLQEKAAEAAVRNKSLLAIFPTGGGKSITFQLPALMAGENVKGLTVVISPLQSLMKDQVDNLNALGLADAVTINGLLNSVERAEAIERVASGIATLLYLSPESLRSRTIEKLLLSRNVVRFVIDEAHCFSAWGQDFRVDYLYIGDFIRQFQKKKNLNYAIPVSCFTATAKQKVISDICDYFKKKLDIDLELYATAAVRTNLRYEVLYKETDDEKYQTLRQLIEQRQCSTIVYVSRTKRTYEIAQKLVDDGFSAKPFNGKMESSEKIENQEDFINGKVQIIVATSAFGMGVDKKDVKLVIHYDISDSLENYVQEAGRAGRDPSIQAECYVLFNENDLDKHFILLNQTKLSQSEIQQIWKAIKDLTKNRPRLCCSALEIARQAGWDESVSEIETRVKTAVSALENADYIQRGQNVPHVYATGILVKSMSEASEWIRNSPRFDSRQAENALRIIKMLISSKNISLADNDNAETRIDYIADILGLTKDDVVESIDLMREDNLLADTQDLTAYIKGTDTQNKSQNILNRFMRLESFLIDRLVDGEHSFNLKELNEQAEQSGVKFTSVKSIKTLLYYWTIKSYISKQYNTSDRYTEIILQTDIEKLKTTFQKRVELAGFIVNHLYLKTSDTPIGKKEEILVQFSILELQKAYKDKFNAEVTFREIQDALLYLSKINSLQLEGGFLVLYNAMEITRIELDNRIKYKQEDYKQLDEFYKHKIQQIHIVGEYANMVVKNYDDALQFVNDYFQLDYQLFLSKYFKGNRMGEINRNITPQKYNQLFANLSIPQRKIIDDDISKNIVVTAGPGSGKTRVLVHKLASLMLLEDVKHEQLLMLTFSRIAATEFKQRLYDLIGNAAAFLDAKTFHSYCFDLMGRVGSIENSKDIVKNAAEMIRNGEVEQGKITKKVIVIDEAQDMDENEFSLIEALMEQNEDLHIIAVGDDDQNIYDFRGSDSKYLKRLIDDYNATKYDLLDNYRSAKSIVETANSFAQTISVRLKSEPICAMSSESGIVKFIKHTSKNMEYPIVNDIKNNSDKGTVCVLTNTNDEAVRVVGLLKKEGIPAQLIQSNDGFDLYDLAELRMFMKYISDRPDDTPIISDEDWNKAIEKLKSYYAGSNCLEMCLRLLDNFSSVERKRYRSDLEMFIHESQISDFYEENQNAVVVSTIHKSKGKEFDYVYMLLNNIRLDNDEQKRRIYVGMTRAKKALYIHYNNTVFDKFAKEIIFDDTNYSAPSEIMVQFTHKDLYLSYSNPRTDIKRIILKHKSGDRLYLRGKLLYENGSKIPIAILSQSAKERLEQFYQKGYQVYDVKIRFIVAWKSKEQQRENAIILPDIYLRKKD